MDAPAADRLSYVRSLLFTPADRPERFLKAARSGADAVILDLEDGVAPDAKSGARAHALRCLSEHAAEAAWVLRINALSTLAGMEDLLALRQGGCLPAAIMLPKAESAEQVEAVAAPLRRPGAVVPIVALVESSRGVAAAEAIASHPAVHALAFGGADLAADLGAEMAWEPLLFARGRIVNAAATRQLAAWDVPFLDLRDEAGLAREAAAVRALGFRGKMAIHPGQVGPINETFSPTPQQVDRATRVVEASRNAGGGVCVVDGKMIDAPVVLAAQRTLGLARRTNGAQRVAPAYP